MRLLSLPDDDDGPEPLADAPPGVVVYWRAPPPATGPRTRRRRAVALRPIWEAQAVRFEVLGMAAPPRTPEDLLRAARLAYAFAASHHPIPSTAVVYYEVRS